MVSDCQLREGVMRKLLVPLCLCLLFFTDLSAETGKSFHVGLDIGGVPITPDVIGYRIGGGIGVKLSKRLGFIAEFGYAVNRSEKERVRNSWRERTTFSSIPLSGSIVLITPVTEGFSAHIGLGVGYYFMKIKEERRYYSTTSEYKTKSDGIAPHVSLAIEAKVGKRTTICASVKEIIGKTRWYGLYNLFGAESKQIHFSGPEIKIGLRYYF
jgi:hypothetical protein